MKKIFGLSLIMIILLFANTANAIVDPSEKTENQQQTEQTTTKKRFLQRIKTDKSEDIDSKDTVTYATEVNSNKVQIKDGSVLSLNDCIDIAIANSPSVQRYKDLVEVANALLGQSKANYFPSLSLGTGYYGDYTSGNRINSDFDNSYNLSASLNQLLFSFGKVGTKIKKAKLNKIAADYDLNYEIIKTIFNVKTNYYAVLAATANIKVQEANILVNERQYQQTKAYFEEGLKSKIDLVNSEVYLSNAKINYVTAQNTYDTAVIALNNSMYIEGSPKYSIAKLETFHFDNQYADVALKHTSQDVEDFIPPALEEGATYQTSVQKNELIDSGYNFSRFPYTLEESINLAREHRPDLKSYIAARDALKKELTYQKIQYLPDLKARGGYGLNANSNVTNSFSIQGTLDFPSINVMDIKYKIEEAQARLQAADSQVFQLEKDIYHNVQKAYVNMVQYEKKIPLTEVAVRQTYENLELAMGRYEVGLGNFLEVQDAIVNYNQAQESYVKLIFDYNVSRAKLELEIAKVDTDNKKTAEEDTKKEQQQ
ncbi:TolC family protein [bacterium]|nr:TolC family protein [bacterium]